MSNVRFHVGLGDHTSGWICRLEIDSFHSSSLIFSLVRDPRASLRSYMARIGDQVGLGAYFRRNLPLSGGNLILELASYVV